MRDSNHVRLMPALLFFLVAFAPVTTAQDTEPDEEVQVTPPVNESTPGGILVPETCDPLDLILCVGPVSEDAPAVVAVSSEGVVLSVWLHEGESEPVGPVQETVTVPVTGTEVPLTLCPNTCPVPVAPEADATGGATVCITVGTDTECVGDADPVGAVLGVVGLVQAALDGADRDGDFVPNEADNCPDSPNLAQSDGDLDGQGDACDADTEPVGGGVMGEVDALRALLDPDNDGIPIIVDNCPDNYNPGQDDGDLDGRGDACDPDTRDLVADAAEAVEDLRDALDGDGDGVPYAVDNCDDVPNVSQTDSDWDGQGDACDSTPGEPGSLPGTVTDIVYEYIPPCEDLQPEQYACFGGRGTIGIRLIILNSTYDI